MNKRTVSILALLLLLVFALSAFADVAAPLAADPQTIVYITRTGSKYHRGSCGSLSKSKIPITLKEAKELGYGPCGRCHPPQ